MARQTFNDKPPLLSKMTPLQLVLFGARAVGLGPRMLRAVVYKMTSKDRKATVFAGYEPRESDAFVACFSKSGTNWAMQIVAQIAHRGAAEFRHIHDLVAWPEASMGGVVPFDDDGPRRAAPTGLRGIKTSLEPEYVPYSPAAKYVSIVRDPKDVCVSGYYFLTGVFGMREHLSPTAWLEMSLEPQGFLANWAVHTAGWWAMRDRANVCVLEFAAMKRDLGGAIDEAAAALGVELDADERAEVVRRAGFEYMRAHESCFAPPHLPILTGDTRGQMVRSGKSGASAELLSAAQREQVDAYMLAELARLGSDFPYAERFCAGQRAGPA